MTLIVLTPYPNNNECLEIKTVLIRACSLKFPLIIDSIPPGHVTNKPMRHLKQFASQCVLWQNKN